MKFLTAIIIALAITGCSTVTGYKPVINEKASKNVSLINENLDYCKPLAAEAAGWTKETIGDALAVSSYSASIGALSGAMISGATSAGTAAGFGAAVGGITGLWYGLYEADETYKRAYNSCMTQLGYSVLW